MLLVEMTSSLSWIKKKKRGASAKAWIIISTRGRTECSKLPMWVLSPTSSSCRLLGLKNRVKEEEERSGDVDPERDVNSAWHARVNVGPAGMVRDQLDQLRGPPLAQKKGKITEPTHRRLRARIATSTWTNRDLRCNFPFLAGNSAVPTKKIIQRKKITLNLI